jgi:hypothetical protein
MQLFKLGQESETASRISFTKRLAFLFCIIASGIGWAAIIGLVLLLRPELLF